MSVSPSGSIDPSSMFAFALHEVAPAQVSTSMHRAVGALLVLALFVRADDSGGRLRRARRALKARLVGRRRIIQQGVSRGELLFSLDSLMCDSGRLVPGQAFGIYGKRGG